MNTRSNIIKTRARTKRLRARPLSLTPFLPLLLLTSILYLLPSSLFPAILTVKQDGTGDFTIIQEACMAANSGDTVLVWPGTYYENILLEQFYNDITIASLYLTTQDESYIHNTIIDGNQNGSCIALRNTGQAEIVVCGFIIQNGSGYGENKLGGGIYAKNASSVSIISNIIKNNTAKGGGGILVNSSDLFLSDNIICHNRAISAGGGIYNLYESQIEFDPIHKNSIYLNYAPIGMDIGKISYSGPMNIILDTCTVMKPDYYFIYSFNVYNFPNNDLTISVDHGKIEPVNSNLYVNPESGNDNNDGLTPETALRTVSWACTKIASDSSNPLNIYLMDGVYSPSTNQERFPFNGRSFVSLVGESRENTIFDADSSYFFYLSDGVQTDFCIKNLTLQNSYEDDNFYMVCGGMYFLCCVEATLQNITVKNCQDNSSSGMGFDYPDKLLLKKISFDNLKGGRVLGMGNSLAPGKTFRCENIAIRNCGPDDDPIQTGGEGFGMGISGSLPYLDKFSGKITNLQITDNLRIPHPNWPPGSSVALSLNYHATVDLINATIGNNVVDGEQGYAVNVDEGSELNIYNSIFLGDSLYELSLGSYSGSDFPATANIAYSNIEGGEDEIMNWYNQHTLNWLDGNMDEDPRWAGTGDTAYYLLNDSPCINAGTPMYEEGMDYPYIKMENGKIVLYKYDGDTIHLPNTDLAGNPRISGGRIDMGAYEYQDTGTAINEFTGKTKNDNKVLVYPNPFTAHTFITFRIQNKTNVLVKISDIKGRTVKTLMDANIPKGEYSMTWEGTDDYGNVIKNGTYITTFYLNGIPVETVKIIKKGFRKY